MTEKIIAADDDFTTIHIAQRRAIEKAMPMLKQVTEYSPENLAGKSRIKTPAILIEIVEIKPGQAVSGGRLAVEVEFVAHCILSDKTSQVQLQVRNLSARLLQVINKNTWGLKNAKNPTELSAFPGMFSEKLGFESWVVSWNQEFHLGEIVLPSDYLPTNIHISESPNIGSDNRDKYELSETRTTP